MSRGVCDEQNAAQEADTGGVYGREWFAAGALFDGYGEWPEQPAGGHVEYSTGHRLDSAGERDPTGELQHRGELYPTSVGERSDHARSEAGQHR